MADVSGRLRYYINEDGVHVNVDDFVASLRRLEPSIEDSRARVGVHAVADALEAFNVNALAEYGRSAAGFQGSFLAEVRRILGG